jgi:hypothetical protein
LDVDGFRGDGLAVNISPQPELRRLVIDSSTDAELLVRWGPSPAPKLEYLEVVGRVDNAFDLLDCSLPVLRTVRLELALGVDEITPGVMELAVQGLKSVTCLDIIEPTPGVKHCACFLTKLRNLQELQLPWVGSNLGDLVTNPVAGMKVAQVNSDKTYWWALSVMCRFAADFPAVLRAKVGRLGVPMPFRELQQLVAAAELDDPMNSYLEFDVTASSWRWLQRT